MSSTESVSEYSHRQLEQTNEMSDILEEQTQSLGNTVEIPMIEQSYIPRKKSV